MVVLSNPSDAYFGCSVMRLSMVAALVLLWGLNSFATKDPYLRTTVPPPWRNLTFFYDSRNPGHAGQHQADRSRFRSRAMALKLAVRKNEKWSATVVRETPVKTGHPANSSDVYPLDL